MRFVSSLGHFLSCKTSLGLSAILPIPQSLCILETFTVVPDTKEGIGNSVASVTTYPAVEEHAGQNEYRQMTRCSLRVLWILGSFPSMFPSLNKHQ